ncbi:alpha-galactosidase [Tunicatimonas pelagia]|uniref:alpha-galactosidase n=1 Tax=Tunicatimonas pelagia TaxID=931531 RepID=UPI00266715C7|nr:alpha-galactosidase [Tunicatimonas pelagia]WKN46161.1 alpha-galactosidase [Tunicatimonas pelagia]
MKLWILFTRLAVITTVVLCYLPSQAQIGTPVELLVDQQTPEPFSVTKADCYVQFSGDSLVLGNATIERIFAWNDGNLITAKLTDKGSGHSWRMTNNRVDTQLPNNPEEAAAQQLSVHWHDTTALEPAYLEATVTTQYIKKVFRIYPRTPAIACAVFFQSPEALVNSTSVQPASDGVERATSQEAQAVTLDRLSLPGSHWQVTNVRFRDATDHNNTLVYSQDQLLFTKPTHLPGNLLFAEESASEHGIFWLKEAPLGENQLAYVGYDFEVKTGEIAVTGPVPNQMGTDSIWHSAYRVVTGVYGSEQDKLAALRSYQHQVRSYQPKRDAMIMMNTWGDRGKDGKINEAFVLRELTSGARLGVTHFQIDDGWQQGLSKNSKSASGDLWDQWSKDDWQPHNDRFPRGLSPIVQRAASLDIQLGLWFHPSNAGEYATWEQDADILIDLYQKHGIKVFKIDGLHIESARAERNLCQMFEKVLTASDGQIVFNLDATAGRRGGYFYLNRYGNIFLENRYTDWGNYYPHWTLRNLWMLSHYIPPQRLQVEFLNKWRNASKYAAADPLAPINVPFDYQVAITLMAQPLAWLEGTGLPEEAFAVSGMLTKYQETSEALHQGAIFPIGQEPNGFSWTGFQSVISKSEGYLMVFRENNAHEKVDLATRLLPNQLVTLKPILGQRTEAQVRTDAQGQLPIMLPHAHSFALYHYRCVPSTTDQ